MTLSTGPPANISRPAGALLHRVGQTSRQVSGLLQEHRRLRHTRDLYVIGAKYCAFLAGAAGDLGQLAAGTAHGCAAQSRGDAVARPASVAALIRRSS
jgi:hypothetical protein